MLLLEQKFVFFTGQVFLQGSAHYSKFRLIYTLSYLLNDLIIELQNPDSLSISCIYGGWHITLGEYFQDLICVWMKVELIQCGDTVCEPEVVLTIFFFLLFIHECTVTVLLLLLNWGGGCLNNLANCSELTIRLRWD